MLIKALNNFLSQNLLQRAITLAGLFFILTSFISSSILLANLIASSYLYMAVAVASAFAAYKFNLYKSVKKLFKTNVLNLGDNETQAAELKSVKDIAFILSTKHSAHERDIRLKELIIDISANKDTISRREISTQLYLNLILNYDKGVFEYALEEYKRAGLKVDIRQKLDSDILEGCILINEKDTSAKAIVETLKQERKFSLLDTIILQSILAKIQDNPSILSFNPNKAKETAIEKSIRQSLKLSGTKRTLEFYSGLLRSTILLSEKLARLVNPDESTTKPIEASLAKVVLECMNYICNIDTSKLKYTKNRTNINISQMIWILNRNFTPFEISQILKALLKACLYDDVKTANPEDIASTQKKSTKKADELIKSILTQLQVASKPGINSRRTNKESALAIAKEVISLCKLEIAGFNDALAKEATIDNVNYTKAEVILYNMLNLARKASYGGCEIAITKLYTTANLIGPYFLIKTVPLEQGQINRTNVLLMLSSKKNFSLLNYLLNTSSPFLEGQITEQEDILNFINSMIKIFDNHLSEQRDIVIFKDVFTSDSSILFKLANKITDDSTKDEIQEKLTTIKESALEAVKEHDRIYYEFAAPTPEPTGEVVFAGNAVILGPYVDLTPYSHMKRNLLPEQRQQQNEPGNYVNRRIEF